VKRRYLVPLLATLMLGLTVGFASVATATPTKTSPCSGCHDLDASVHVTATFVSATATGTTYAISVNNPYGGNGWAVFQGSTKSAGTAGNGANVALPNGVTSTIFGVSGDGNGTQGYATLSVTPATPDLTAPTTTSNALATYLSSASITLSATDNIGGSGVAHTYYILDSGTQTEGTTVNTSVVGAHTLEFWSVDVATNVESPHKSANFEVTAPIPDTTAPITTSNAQTSYLSSAVINLMAADNLGGVGLGHTYFILDSGSQTEGTTISTSVIGTHSVEFWSVDASGNVETPHNFANFEVTADTTAPTTTSDAKPSYVAVAAIHLSATDNVGGVGVAHTYYVLDSGSQTEGTTISTSVVGTHSVEFWSVDASGNVEAPHTVANFAVTAAPVVASKYTVTYKFNLRKHTYKHLKAVLTSNAKGHKRYTVTISKKGVATFRNIPRGLYKLSTSGNARFKFKARTVRVGPA
jgi:hypothetical protein